MIRNSNSPLAQIVKRVSEKEKARKIKIKIKTKDTWFV